MKKLLFLSVLFVSVTVFSQEFTYKRIFSNGSKLKLKGKIVVKDSMISIYTNNVPANFKVKKIVSNEKQRQYLALQTGAGYQIKFIITDVPMSKKETSTFLIETTDLSTNAVGQMLYPLIPKKD